MTPKLYTKPHDSKSQGNCAAHIFLHKESRGKNISLLTFLLPLNGSLLQKVHVPDAYNRAANQHNIQLLDARSCSFLATVDATCSMWQ